MVKLLVLELAGRMYYESSDTEHLAASLQTWSSWSHLGWVPTNASGVLCEARHLPTGHEVQGNIPKAKTSFSNFKAQP